MSIGFHRYNGGCIMSYVKKAFFRGIGPFIFMSMAAYFMRENGKAHEDYKGYLYLI